MAFTYNFSTNSRPGKMLPIDFVGLETAVLILYPLATNLAKLEPPAWVCT